MKEPLVEGVTEEKERPVPGSKRAAGRGQLNVRHTEERKANIILKSEDRSER